MGAEHLNPLGSLKISASITNALLIITRFVHDSSGALALPSVMCLCLCRHPVQAALLTAHLVTALLTWDQKAASNSIMIAELSRRGPFHEAKIMLSKPAFVVIVCEPFNFNCGHRLLVCSLLEDGRGWVAQLYDHIKSFLRGIIGSAGLSKMARFHHITFFSSAFCLIYWNYNLPREHDWKENGFLKCPAHPTGLCW